MRQLRNWLGTFSRHSGDYLVGLDMPREVAWRCGMVPFSSSSLSSGVGEKKGKKAKR